MTFVPGTGITKIALAVRGVVPGMDPDAFAEAAEAAAEKALQELGGEDQLLPVMDVRPYREALGSPSGR